MSRTDTNEPSSATPTGAWWSRGSLQRWIESSHVQYVVIAVILINAVSLGLETSDTMVARYGPALNVIDQACLTFFVIELGIKLYAFRLSFFRTSWNVFDLVIVTVALIPGSGPFGVLRALRVLRVLRLISVIPQLRRVVEALVKAVPGILSIGALLTLLFYVGGVMATMLFGESFPTEFGTLPRSLLSLFQVMTLDNWSVITRSVIEVYPWAPAFFVPFILLSAFTVLNLFIAVIVDAMQHMRPQPDVVVVDVEGEQVGDVVSQSNEPTPPERATGTDPRDEPHAPAREGALEKEVAALRAEIAALAQLLRERDGSTQGRQ